MPTGEPSTVNRTDAMLSLSAAFAARVTVLARVEPAVGCVTETVGGVVSHALVVSVSVERAETFPAPS